MGRVLKRARPASSVSGRRGVMLVTIVVGCWLAAPAGALAADGVVELPVSFQVKNTNTSGASCPSDGADYTVRGHITAPSAALAGSGPSALAVYLTGLEVGEWNWRFTSVPGYDWPAEMAKLGQTSLTIDLLGYGASGHPSGDYSCYGSQADVTHQIVEQLRRGDYQIADRPPVKFARIVLVGHDVGGGFAQIEAYSYQDIDGLIVLTWADQGQTPLILERSFRTAQVCTAGGEQAYPGGPPGYFYIERPEEYQPDLFYNFDPAVLAAFLGLRERNPCGYEPTTAAALGTDVARLGEIHVPVLLAIGAEDKIFSQAGWSQQQGHFTGSNDVTAVSLANTGHYPMLERTAPQLRTLVANWLSRHGVAAPPPKRAAGPLPAPSRLVAIPPQTVTVGHDRIVRVRLTCQTPTGSPCIGSLRLDATPSRAYGTRAASKFAPGAWNVRVQPGKAQAVKARLSRRGYRLLKHRHLMRAWATVSQRSDQGTVVTVRATVVLKAAVRRRRA